MFQLISVVDDINNQLVNEGNYFREIYFSYLAANLTASLPVFSLIFPVPSFRNFCMLTFTSLSSCGRLSSCKCFLFCLMPLHTVLESGEHSHVRYIVSDFSQSAVRKSKKVAHDANGRVMFYFFAELRSAFIDQQAHRCFLQQHISMSAGVAPLT